MSTSDEGDSGDPRDDADEPRPANTPADPRSELAAAQRKRDLYAILRAQAAGRNASYAVAPATAVFEAAGVTRDGGDPTVVGHLVLALGRFLSSISPDIILTALSFTNSVELELTARPSSQEAQRLADLRNAEAASTEPIEADVRARALPSAVVGLEAAAYIFDQDPDQVPERVRLISARARTELRKLTAEMEKRNAELTFVSPTAARVHVNQRRARRYHEELREAEAAEPLELTIAGRLSVTDSDSGTFRVVLDPNRRPEELDARRKHVEGAYTDDASAQVRDRGLWDKDVVATVEVIMEVPAGGGKARPAEFLFTGVRPAAG